MHFGAQYCSLTDRSQVPEAGPSGTNHEPPPAEPRAAPLPVPPLPVSHPPEQITDPLQLALLPVSVPDTSEQLKTYVNNLVRLTTLKVPHQFNSECSHLQTQVQLLQATKAFESRISSDVRTPL